MYSRNYVNSCDVKTVEIHVCLNQAYYKFSVFICTNNRAIPCRKLAKLINACLLSPQKHFAICELPSKRPFYLQIQQTGRLYRVLNLLKENSYMTFVVLPLNSYSKRYVLPYLLYLCLSDYSNIWSFALFIIHALNDAKFCFQIYFRL